MIYSEDNENREHDPEGDVPEEVATEEEAEGATGESENSTDTVPVPEAPEGDVPEATEDEPVLGEEPVPEAIPEAETAEYEILSPVQYYDENGVHQGQLLAGDTHVLPVVIGDRFVLEGSARKVE